VVKTLQCGLRGHTRHPHCGAPPGPLSVGHQGAALMRDEESLASCEAWASFAEPLHWPNRGVWG
jgi:hypothetical protein